MKLLTDSQMQEFIVKGYVKIEAAFTPAFHDSVRAQAERIFSTTGNPGNDILPAIPLLADLFTHPAVTGALTSVLGPGYAMHPHRHCHLTPPRKSAQRQHQDSYEDDQNVRHHRTRWAMAFYYPQDVNVEMGPTSVLPASQYYTSRDQAEKQEEALLCGKAGTVTIVHYDLWHRATTNRSDRNRFMMKFLFCRMEEPTAPSWSCSKPARREWAASDKLTRLRHNVWDWYLGNEIPTESGSNSIEKAVPAIGPGRKPAEKRESQSEADRLEEAYRLSCQGQEGTETLMEMWEAEAIDLLEANLAARHTNPSQLFSSFGLSAQGAAAVPGLLKALESEQWPLRAAAADILGDIGLQAGTAVPGLIDRLEDESEWVRRNAAEAIGNISAPEGVSSLARLLSEDSCHFVRHNAALALAKIGPRAQSALPALRQAQNDENDYVQENARLALTRIQAPQQVR